ncbi:MAG: WecB/TagA/CpsF family glycosyltransferase [Geminicoccaceae bacterium]|nr:WecB/TagA/CpsF family glycosyltransferase [Geminicoccaceae bacterium]MCS7268252.1 WecB/TagA/CpsF family glycosyltransferase [Geminicoccaceae bacterium]MCX7630812.1 WecB/TagA/CpsF family glycosyltransferase [Geminicoccaceae bacterium]MDW8125116.1 WecB/TagA/CpsF family glycosyltransferase [Geminicoccaceae bacterium]MDW8340891.1 WecB/TagA/CpsF family glycosyltransferase [Geminicoccaceae bacterium]
MPTILGTRVDAVGLEEAAERILAWARSGRPAKVAAANVHMLVEARDDPAFAAALAAFDLVTPDGMPLVWRLRRLGFRDQERVYGPDLMLEVCARAAARGVPVGIFGGSPSALAGCCAALAARFPGLVISYAFAPPVRPAGTEDPATLAAIRASGARILFVALGCPKQEKWIALNAPELPCVAFAVGAAVDFLSGRVPQAPRWLQRAGLEWAFRLACDPKRLWRRYAYTNTRFLAECLLGRL